MFWDQNSIYQFEEMLFNTKNVSIGPKLVWNHCFSYIFGFDLVQSGLVWFGFGSNSCFKVTIQFPVLYTCFLIPNMSILAKNMSESMVLAIFLVLVWFGLILVWLQWSFHGQNAISQFEYMFYDTKHVTIDPKYV